MATSKIRAGHYSPVLPTGQLQIMQIRVIVLDVAKCNLGKVKIEASAGQRCPHGWDMRGGQPTLQGPLGSYSSHVCANSFRICSLAGACAVEVCCFFFVQFFSFYVFVMSRNTHNSLQARLFPGDVSYMADGSSSSQCETSLPSTPASATLAASAAPTLSPEMISLITQTVRAAMVAEKPASEQVQAVPSAVSTASAGGVPASNSLDTSAASFLASGNAIPLRQLLQGRPSSCVVAPSFVQMFAAPVMSLAPSFTPPSNVIHQASALATQPASLLDQSFVVGPGFSPVPAKLVAQIVGGKYVDLSDLLASNLQQREPEPQLMFDGRLLLTSQPKRQHPRIEDIASWMEAFSIFSLMLSSHFAHRWKDLHNTSSSFCALITILAVRRG